MLFFERRRKGQRERGGQAEVLAQELKVHNGQGWARLQLGAKTQWSLTWMARTPSLELLAPSVYLNRKLKLELNLGLRRRNYDCDPSILTTRPNLYHK